MVYAGSIGYILEEKDYVPSKGTLGHYLAKQRDKSKGPGYYALKGLDKLGRPLIHVGDYIGKGIDWAGDQIMKTRIGRKAHEYVFDPEGKHPVARAIGLGALHYGLNRWSRERQDKMRLPQYRTSGSKIGKGIDAIDAGMTAYSAAGDSLKRGAMSKKKLAAHLKKEHEKKMQRRRERDQRMNNFWKDMKW